MNWASRMARQGTDLSLHSLSMNSGNAVLTPSSNMHSTKVTSGTEAETGKSSALSPTESRIPRPSPTALRRSASLRLRGERGAHLRSPIVSSTIHNYQIRNNSNHIHNYLQSQCNQQELFPIINENGSELPRHRSSVSFF